VLTKKSSLVQPQLCDHLRRMEIEQADQPGSRENDFMIMSNSSVPGLQYRTPSPSLNFSPDPAK
ncbi:MAG TPA: hypothetical protein VF607_12520, partial [Verrucomicrobiae bacterium]